MPISTKCKEDIVSWLSEEKLFRYKNSNKYFKKLGIKKEVRNGLVKRLTSLVKVPLICCTLKKEDTKNLFGEKKLTNKANSQKHKIIDAKNDKNNQNNCNILQIFLKVKQMKNLSSKDIYQILL